MKELKKQLRKKIKEKYVTIKNFCEKKELDYLRFRVWLQSKHRTRTDNVIAILGEFGDEFKQLKQTLKRSKNVE